jgi:hypothetical protein
MVNPRARTAFAVIARGFAAGLAGTLALNASLDVVSRLQYQEDDAFAEQVRGRTRLDPRGQVVDRLAGAFLAEPLTQSERANWALLAHWLYGGLWGMVFAILRSSIRLPFWAHPVLAGLTMWVIGPRGLARVLGLRGPTRSAGVADSAIGVAVHQAYGWATAIAFEVLSGRR